MTSAPKDPLSSETGEHATLRGIIPYLVSPVDDAGAVLEGPLRELVHRLIEAGVDGLSPLGSTGDVMYLTPQTQSRIVEIVVDEARGRVPVVPGVAAFSSAQIADEVRRVNDCGADGVVVMKLNYFQSDEDGVTGFFRAAAAATDAPVVLYTNPKLGDVLPVEAIRQLSELPNVRYLKDASGVTGRLLSVQEAAGDRVQIFAASAHIPATVFELGGVGWMGGPVCLAPRASVLLWRLHERGDRAGLWRLQRALWPLNQLFTKYGLSAFVKAGLRAQGISVGRALPPQQDIPQAALEELSRALSRIDGVVNALEGSIG